jgi:hypothetical protein
MTVQVFLTVWLVLQIICRCCRQPELNRLREQTEKQLVAAIGGNVLWGIGMFACLYYGGFYN